MYTNLHRESLNFRRVLVLGETCRNMRFWRGKHNQFGPRAKLMKAFSRICILFILSVLLYPRRRCSREKLLGIF